MSDVSQITSQIWVGGALSSEADIQQIESLGITADVDCRLEFDDKSLILNAAQLPPTPASLDGHPTIAYLYAGVADDGTPKPVSWFQTVWEFAEPLLKDKGVVLCHCAAGVNRGPSMGYFLLRAYGKMSGDDAYGLLKGRRPVVQVAYRSSADGAIAALGL